MSRWQASAIHFSISLGVFLGLLALILFLWYPGILFSVGGGWAGLRIVFGVDLILGPLLTLIVFKAGKPGLKFDLSCIVIFQIACMIGGMSIVYNERPLAIVLAYDTFFSVDKEELEEFGRDPDLLKDFPGAYPKLIYVELPGSDVEAEIAAVRAQFIGDPLYIQTEKYRAIPELAEESAAVFRGEEAARRSATEAILSDLGDDCVFSKFVSSVTSGFVCFDLQNRKLSKFYETEVVPPVTIEQTADN